MSDPYNHDLKPFDDVKICEDCGAAFHPTNGYWFLGGYRSRVKPPCTPFKTVEWWVSDAESIIDF